MSIKIPDGDAELKRAYEPPAAQDGTRIPIGCLGCAGFWPTIWRLMVTAPQSLVRSLLDSTCAVVLANISGAADRAIDAGCAWIKAHALNDIRRTSHNRVATTPRSRPPPEAPGAHLVH